MNATRPTAKEMFIGPDGWIAAAPWVIYLLIAGALFLMFSGIVGAAHLQTRLRWEMAMEVAMLMAAIVPGFVMSQVERRPFGDFGLPVRCAFGPDFWVGTLWGFAWISLFMLALCGLGAFSYGSLAVHGARAGKFAAYYAIFFLMTGLFEEFAWRGYSQWALTRAINFWPAALLLSISFGAIHAGNRGESKVGVLAVVALGFFFCLTLRRTGTLWWAVGFHMSWDFAESFVYSVPDSGNVAVGHLLNSSLHGPSWLTGGTVGPEGSWLIFILIPALWFAFHRAYPEVRYGEVKGQSSD